MNQRRRLKLALAGAFFALGCNSDTPWEAEGITYYARADDPHACEAVLPRITEYRQQVADFVGQALPESLVYRKYADENEVGNYCPANTHGCFANSGEIHTSRALHHHELVHDVTRDLEASKTLFSEGLATAIACSPTDPLGTLFEENLHLDAKTLAGQHYVLWGAVVTELLRRGPLEDVWKTSELFETGGSDALAMDAALTEVYGESLAEIWSELEEERKSSCIPVGRCDQALVEEGTNSVLFDCDGLHERVLDSSLGRAIGITSAPEAVVLQACDLDAPPWSTRDRYLVYVRDEVEVSGTFAIVGSSLEPQGGEVLTLTPKTPHLMTVRSQWEGEASVEVRKLQGAFGGSCSDVENEFLTRGPTALRWIAAPDEEGDYWFHLEVTEEPLNLSRGGDVDELWLCPQCPERLESDCQELGSSTTLYETSFLMLRRIGPPKSRIRIWPAFWDQQ